MQSSGLLSRPPAILYSNVLIQVDMITVYGQSCPTRQPSSSKPSSRSGLVLLEEGRVAKKVCADPVRGDAPLA